MDNKELIEKYSKPDNELKTVIMGDMIVTEYIPEKDKKMLFMDICNKMYDTYVRKNADYGDSFGDMYNDFGLTSSVIRLTDKVNRLKSLNAKQVRFVVDESIEDTLLDLANYSVMTLVELRKNKVD